MLSKIFIAEIFFTGMRFYPSPFITLHHPSSPFVSGSAFIPLYYKKKQ